MCFREYESHSKQCEDTKEKFSEFDRQDVKCREDIKHTKAKIKKLEKTLEQEEKEGLLWFFVSAASTSLRLALFFNKGTKKSAERLSFIIIIYNSTNFICKY